MADLDYLRTLNKTPTLESLIKLYGDYLEHGKESLLGDLRTLGTGSPAYKRIERFLDSIGISKSEIRTDGNNNYSLDGELASQIFQHVAKIVEQFDGLLNISGHRSRGAAVSVVLATSQLLGTRPLPPWLREFHRRFSDLRTNYRLPVNTPPPQTRMVYAEPYELSSEYIRNPHVDLILTYCDPQHHFADDVEIERVPLHRCMLVRMDEVLQFARTVHSLISGRSGDGQLTFELG